ncbi:hypothetical protein NliqN6_3995 [Naganishia liquefaciens]|uniref:Uncharacterized protein n=1 Tax=Naganishia liquefaciens TaxID=104408 RepID=A0A8H3YFT0_9TREE|nr:hypothetical protein NliqN6_3995 [Naganishia liquefaciens]
MVPLDEYGVMVGVPKQFKMFAERSRDPTVSSFEAFVLAPSSSSFTIYDKNNGNKNDQPNGDLHESALEGKEREKPNSSPLKNQVKVSIESRRTITSAKASSDTIRSGATTIESSHSIPKSKQSWKLFSRFESPNSARTRRSEDSDRTNPPSPSKLSPKSAVTPRTQRKFRKLSVQPVSPLQIPPLSQEIQPKKSSSRRTKALRDGETSQTNRPDMSPPASDKTIRSFSALNRASIDTPVMTQRGYGWSIPLLTVHETPTKRKGGSENLCMTNGPDAAALSLADQANNNGRIRLVSGNPRTVPRTSINGIPRVETRYVEDGDLVLRLEANERDHLAAGDPHKEGDARQGYWDYSIVTGVGGSPSREYAMVLRNASILKSLADLPSLKEGKGNSDSIPASSNEEVGASHESDMQFQLS